MKLPAIKSILSWNPASPNELIRSQTTILKETSDEVTEVDTLYSHPGNNANMSENDESEENETNLILSLLDIRDNYYGTNSKKDDKMLDIERKNELEIKVADEYRSLLFVYIYNLQYTNVEEENNRQRLEGIYSILNLMRIFLLAKHATQIRGGISSQVNQYLRYHAQFYTDTELDEMLSSTKTANEENPNYWKLMNHYISMGYTKLAWKLLTKHSKYQKCQNTPDEEGFMDLYLLLNCAPLPGGSLPNTANDEEELLLAVPPPFSTNSSKEWDSLQSLSSAYEHWSHWSAFSKHCHKRGLRNNLQQRIPRLANILNLLAGEKNANFKNWQDELLYDLLYRNPYVLSKDIARKATRYMSNEDDYVELITYIMNGDAAKAIHGLYELGGQSGAPLPTTIISLLFELLVKGECLPFSETSEPLLIHLFSNAASACQASLRNSIAQRCAYKLLSYIPNEQIKKEHLEIFLSHISVFSDVEANTLIDYCQFHELTAQSTSIAISRGDFYVKQCQPAGAAHWFLKSIELSPVKPAVADSKLIQLTYSTAQMLYISMNDEKQLQDVWIPYTSEIIKTLENYPSLDQLEPRTAYAIQFLQNTFSLAQEKENNAVIASNIISILSDSDEYLPHNFRLLLLRIAHALIEEDQSFEDVEEDDIDTQGINVLPPQTPIFKSQDIYVLFKNLSILEIYQVTQDLYLMRKNFSLALRRAIALEQYDMLKKKKINEKVSLTLEEEVDSFLFSGKDFSSLNVNDFVL